MLNRHNYRAMFASDKRNKESLVEAKPSQKLPISPTAHTLPRPQRKPSAPTVKKPLPGVDTYKATVNHLAEICQAYGIPPHEAILAESL